MLLDNLFKNFIYDPVSVLGLLVFYFLLINLPISLVAVFKKQSSLTVKILFNCKITDYSCKFINNFAITF